MPDCNRSCLHAYTLACLQELRKAAWEVLHRAPVYCMVSMYGYENEKTKCAFNITGEEVGDTAQHIGSRLWHK